MDDKRRMLTPEDIPQPRSEEQREQALAIGMMVLGSIQNVIEDEQLFGVPHAGEVIIQNPDNGSRWRIEVRRADPEP